MKVITLTQPWASLMACDAKRWETRSWKTEYRGFLAIHAAKSFPRDCRQMCNLKVFRNALFKDVTVAPETLPLGAIIAVGILVDVQPTILVKPDFPESVFGNYDPNRFVWMFEHIQRIEPIIASGSLGLWNCFDPVLNQLEGRQ